MRKKLTFTKQEAIRLHRKQWHWLAKNPTKQKRHWPGWKRIKETVFNDCFACQYAMEKGDDCKSCAFCPFLWNGAKTCQGAGSPYQKWFFTDKTDTARRAQFAFEVATLKVRRQPR